MNAPVKSNLRVEFTESGLTSYAGLELLLRYFRSIGPKALARRHMGAVSLGGNYGVIPMVRLVLGLVVVDGSVVSTGLQVERAFRGFNPHHRKVPSYYPITAHLAETGHMLQVRHRSGNVHDGKSSIQFLKNIFQQVDETLGKGYRLTFRMDGAFFLAPVFQLFHAKGAGYAIKVPFWQWLDLTRRIRERRRWKRVSSGVSAFAATIPAWDFELRVVIYRKRVYHKSPKNYQLDLFDPDDGHYEYSAIATNLGLNPRRLWNFMAGRGSDEKVIGQLVCRQAQ